MATLSAIQHESGAAVPIPELPAVIRQRLGVGPLFVRYLRRKPGRGLCIVYHAGEHAECRWVTLTLGEAALAGTEISVPADASLKVQLFPEDERLPDLAACCNPVPGGPVFSALETAARVQLGAAAWQLTAAQAEPVRYKPSDRCVIRYRLRLEQAAACRQVTLFGKLYSDPEKARAIHAPMEELHAEQARQGAAIVPRPLGIEEALGLTLSEAIQPPDGAEPQALRAGRSALQPRFRRGPGGKVVEDIPAEELRLAAAALARLHTSAVRPAGAVRTGAKEAKRVRERAAQIGTLYLTQAGGVELIANELAQRLEALQPEAYLPAHGGFKPSQLLFLPRQVFVIDFDGFCLADPALDAGYFLAYLRPSGLWYQRAGLRQWFETAAATFLGAYRQALLERGLGRAPVDGILGRARLYQAALLFKIAAHRVHRLNSPRCGELAAMLAEIVDLTNSL